MLKSLAAGEIGFRAAAPGKVEDLHFTFSSFGQVRSGV
jgi:hypothetical protein